jgi:hypothetical protein
VTAAAKAGVLEMLQSELTVVAAYAAAVGLPLEVTELSEDNPHFYVTFYNADGDEFFADFDCRDYPMYPPTVEFVDAKRQHRGHPGLYPNGFHPTPCVCMRYNRKAYSEKGGPHGDWRLIDWQLPTANGIGIDTLAMIVSDLHSKISSSHGRLA